MQQESNFFHASQGPVLEHLFFQNGLFLSPPSVVFECLGPLVLQGC